MSVIKKGFKFYYHWCEIISEYYDEGDKEAAYLLSIAIIRLCSRGELIKLPRTDLNIILKYIILPDIEAQIKNCDN